MTKKFNQSKVNELKYRSLHAVAQIHTLNINRGKKK